ncbi:MAG TPA: ABC transporter substrate-binding protein [Solirubrobacteraceae bacterium]|jgi:branched-chain amino acid transport system substrate-binding protein|nr:ABC transporter substrate-binding protein [Solirubrobacteraceae bacterium]
MSIKKLAAVVVVACAALAAAVGGAGAHVRSGRLAARASSSALGKPDAAKGKPVVFGADNMNVAPGAEFPESEEAASATVKYLNAYKGGLDGHPIKIDWCGTDGTPSGSASCAKQLIADHPVAIIGASDLASADTLPAYAKAHLAYLGGMDFTPVESTASNSIIFNDTAQLGNVLAGEYSVKGLGGKKVAVIAFGNTQGEFSANVLEQPAIKAAGGTYELFAVPPTSATVTSTVEEAVTSGAQVISLEDPGQCLALLQALKEAGWTGKVMSIDTCSAPVTVQAAGAAANGMYWFQPFQVPATETPQAKLASAILAKYAPAKIPIDSPALTEVSTVMDIWSQFHGTPVSKLTSAYMLKALKSGKNHPNFLGQPYTCKDTAIPAYPAVCNSSYYLYHIVNGKAVRVGTKSYDEGAGLIKK